MVTWLDGRSKQRLIEELFDTLDQNLQEFVNHTKEVPYGYSERTLVGQLAIAAHDRNYYALQDYDVLVEGRVEKDKKKRYRPDLWLTEKDSDAKNYVFEVKAQDYASVDVSRDRIIEIVNLRMRKVLKQLSDHGQPEAKYRCALMAIKIRCSPTKWRTHGADPQSYKKAFGDLSSVVSSLSRGDFVSKPDFHSLFSIPHNNAKRLCRKIEGQEQPPLLGILWYGVLKLNK